MTTKREKTGKKPSIKEAELVFHEAGGILRTKDALAHGIHPSVLYQLRDLGKIVQVSRGVYRLTKLKPLHYPDFVPIAIKVPKGVICLISALAFHELTLQIPHEVSIALIKGDWPPRIAHPPIKIYWYSPKSHSTGVEVHHIQSIPIKIYSAEKSIVDCFQFRNKIGIDTAIEALKIYKEKRKRNIAELMHFAKIARVQNVMKPYLESLL
jgi:predicted transcriptional regulator of viral defense system